MTDYDSDGKEIKVPEKLDKQRKAAFNQICKKAILVNMTRKQISNMPFDVQSSNQLCEMMEVTDQHMFQVRKLLFNPQRLSKIRSLINDALLMVWNHTRPWDNIGFRLLPMEYYDDFTETFSKIKDEFEEAVKEFIDNYDEILEESKKMLGKAFNKHEYPDKSQLSNYFSLEMHTAKFPDIDDIRLNLSGPELVEMQKDLVDKYQQVQKAQIQNIIAHIGMGDKSQEDIDRLIDIAEKLNIDEDAELVIMIEEIKNRFKLAKMDKSKKEKKDESMMVADDIEGMDEVIDGYL